MWRGREDPVGWEGIGVGGSPAKLGGVGREDGECSLRITESGWGAFQGVNTLARLVKTGPRWGQLMLGMIHISLRGPLLDVPKAWVIQ